MGEFWKWIETKRTVLMYVVKYSEKHEDKYCTFTEFKERVETDSGLKWEELVDWGGDKIDDPAKVAVTRSIPELLEELKKCRLWCGFCHNFGENRSWGD